MCGSTYIGAYLDECQQLTPPQIKRFHTSVLTDVPRVGVYSYNIWLVLA